MAAFIAINQIGYTINDTKCGYAISEGALTDLSFKIMHNGIVAYSGTMIDKGNIWNKHVYSVEFSDLTATGDGFVILSNNIASYEFSIKENIWGNLLIDLMAYYRMQRSATDTAALMGLGDYGKKYGSNPLVVKGYHPKSHLDDAWDSTKTVHYDITGGWYDAGDYGIYSENQWVTGQMAITYLENIFNEDISFDYDEDGIPDIIEEIIFGAAYSIKMIEAFRGYGYNIQRYADTDKDDKGNWKHPEKYTDNKVEETPNDDRYAHETSKSVEGSAKMAASLAAAARTVQTAIALGKIKKEQLPNCFLENCITNSLIAYDTAKAFDGKDNYPKSNYLSKSGLNDSLLWAEVELYLLDKENNEKYFVSAKNRIMNIKDNDLYCTNYWNLAPLALSELYPCICGDNELSAMIQSLLTHQVNRFIESTNETVYGVLNEFSDFGINEPHVSYISDAIRYHRLFKTIDKRTAERALAAAKKGLDWVFGANPWNISWVSGAGTHYVKYIHSRLDENAVNETSKEGMILPGAMVCGAVLNNPENDNSESPWYADLPVHSSTNQWRYNEHSISIQIGLFNSVISLLPNV